MFTIAVFVAGVLAGVYMNDGMEMMVRGAVNTVRGWF